MPIYTNAPKCGSLAALLLVAACGSSGGEESANQPPTIIGVTLSPGSPVTTDDLVAMPGEVSDPDGDPVTLSYAWTNNGTPVANTSNTVPASETVKDTTWQVTVTPNDGKVDGQPVTASVTIGNAPPMVTMNLAENHLPGMDNILCNATQMDADGDLVLNFTWLEDGVAYAGPFSSTTFANDTLPANVAHSGHIYTCEVSYNDGSGLVKLTRATTAYPNLILIANDTLVAGDHLFHEVSIPAGVTLTTQGLVNITAKSVNIAGVVSGNGQGNAGGAATSGGAMGVGPGAGTPASPMNSGSGGGSYGGVGGTGGFDAGDTPGVGGAIYGTDSAQTIEMGSGGAASDGSAGGAGGGALRLSSKTITVSGSIEMNGASGQQPGSGRGGGGGSGGGILIIGGTVALTGTLSANGGGGSIGTSTANDDGGGGGGGRIKIFHQGALTSTATVTVNGGPVGTFGTAGPPTPGGIGVVHIEQLP